MQSFVVMLFMIAEFISICLLVGNIIQGDQKVCVHLMITIQSSGAQRLFDHPVLLDVLNSDTNCRQFSNLIETIYMGAWRGPCSTQRQAQGLISGPGLVIGAQLLSSNSTQFRVVIGLLTGHNTLRRHLYIMGLSSDPMCRKCTKEETSVHILCECEALASLRHPYLGSFFLDPEDIRVLGMGAIWNFC